MTFTIKTARDDIGIPQTKKQSTSTPKIVSLSHFQNGLETEEYDRKCVTFTIKTARDDIGIPQTKKQSTSTPKIVSLSHFQKRSLHQELLERNRDEFFHNRRAFHSDKQYNNSEKENHYYPPLHSYSTPP